MEMKSVASNMLWQSNKSRDLLGTKTVHKPTIEKKKMF